MRKLYYLFAVCFIIGTFGGNSFAQKDAVRKRHTLTHHMSQEEKALFHTVGKDAMATDPPPGEIRNIAEFDQMEGVLVGYPGNFGIPYSLIAAMSQITVVVTIVENNNQLNFVTNQYQSNGVNMDNAEFIVTALDSYWTRDYGPWYVAYGNDQIGIIDFTYNRPNRPNDNAVPAQVANYLGIEWFGMTLITAGGNYMTNGEGISSATELTWEENPTLTPAEIDQMLLDYCGIDNYMVVPDPNNTYIDHIDCWGKFIDVDKILIREVPSTHPQYDEIEATADFYANQVSSWGDNFEVYRVWTPNNEPYTNSLILNDHVYVPITGGQYDDEAIAAYEAAMPGYTVLGFTGSWESTDALHCRTKGIADRNTLYIKHSPLLGDQPVQIEYDLEAEITAYSDEAVLDSTVKVVWWINDVQQDDIVMTHDGGKMYSVTFPAPQEGSKISYYLTATDDGGNTANHPYIGAPDPHEFFVGEELFPAMALDVSEIEAYVNQGNTAMEYFSMSNTGDIDLNYSLTFSSAVLEDHSYEIDDSPGQFDWDDNTFTELGWVEFTIDNLVGEIGNWHLDFDWATDQYYTESTFYVESPNGTIAVIAAGIPNGNYSIGLDAFNGEQIQGTWKLWIEDSYGDGGHQATNITMTITKTYVIYPWLNVYPVGGTISPAGSQQFEVTCNGSVLPVGDYVGSITITSNDPDMPVTEIPVYFTVDLPSGVGMNHQNSNFSNHPNPFKGSTTFEFTAENTGEAHLTIFNTNGELIRSFTTIAKKGIKTRINWNGSSNSGEDMKPGIYIYHFMAGGIDKTGKVVMGD